MKVLVCTSNNNYYPYIYIYNWLVSTVHMRYVICCDGADAPAAPRKSAEGGASGLVVVSSFIGVSPEDHPEMKLRF